MKLSLKLLVLLAALPCANAATWNGAAGDDRWMNEGNWANSILPTSTESLSFNAPAKGVYEIIIDGAAGVGSLSVQDKLNLVIKAGGTLSSTGGASNSWTNNTMNFGWGANSLSVLTIEDGGTYDASTAYSKYTYIGLNGGSAIVNIDKGGVFKGSARAANLYNLGGYYVSIGNGGSALVNLNGTMTGYNISVGHNNSAGTFGSLVDDLPDDEKYNGKMIMDDDSALLQATGELNVGHTFGSYGILILNAGTAKGGSIKVGNQKDSRGYLQMNGGLLSATNQYVGYQSGATGILELNGGKIDATTLILGGSAAGTTDGIYYEATEGTMIVNGGEINVTTLQVGNKGKGTLEIATNQVQLNHRTTAGVLTNITNGGGDGTVKFTYKESSLAFANNMSGTGLKVVHDSAGTTTLSGNSSYQAGTYLNDGIIIAAHEKAIGNGMLYVQGGEFQFDGSIAKVSTGGVQLTSGTMAMMDDIAQEMALTGTFSMSGGSLELDILSLNLFDHFTGKGGALTFTGGVLDLSGYEGFEGIVSGKVKTGNIYALFSGFAAMGEEIVDGDGVLTINGYDKTNWTAKIDVNGNLVFESTNIPEPATAALGLLGIAGLLMRRRR